MRAVDPHHPKLRIAALAVFAFGCINHGVAYATLNPSGPGTLINTAPPHLLAGIWITTGTAIFIGIWHRLVARIALSFGAALCAVSGLSFYAAWIFGDAQRAWSTAGTFLTVAGAMVIISALCDTVRPPQPPVADRGRVG